MCEERRQELGRPSWFLGRECQVEYPEHIARGLDDHEGVRAAHSTLRRESRAHGEGADRHTELAQETLPEQEGSDHNANLPARQSTEGEKPEAVSVSEPLGDAQCGLVERLLA